jgi:hypothetical protein
MNIGGSTSSIDIPVPYGSPVSGFMQNLWMWFLRSEFAGERAE